jgi:hypothetical protein
MGEDKYNRGTERESGRQTGKLEVKTGETGTKVAAHGVLHRNPAFEAVVPFCKRGESDQADARCWKGKATYEQTRRRCRGKKMVSSRAKEQKRERKEGSALVLRPNAVHQPPDDKLQLLVHLLKRLRLIREAVNVVELLAPRFLLRSLQLLPLLQRALLRTSSRTVKTIERIGTLEGGRGSAGKVEFFNVLVVEVVVNGFLLW